MKIAILHDSFPPNSVGGADIIAFNLAQAFRTEGHEVLVITTTRKREEEGSLTFEGLKIHRIFTSYDLRFQAYVSLWNVPVVRKVKYILKEFKPDVVHAHNVHAYLSYRSLVVSKKLCKRVILTCHDVMPFNYAKLTEFIDPNNLSVPETFKYRVSAWQQFRKNRFRYNPLRNIIIRRTLRRYVDQVLAVSNALKQALEDNGIGRVEVVHNGIDTKEWEESAERIAEFKRAHVLGNQVVLFGGRLSGVKGGGKLLEALSRVVKTVPDLQLLVVGKKDMHAEIMLSEAKRYGLEGKLLFTGWISGRELHRAYHCAAVIAVPSLCFDSFPTMNLEAMACHKPVIATCFGGSSELVVDEETGYIINPYNVGLFAEKLTGLLSDPKKSTLYGEKGYLRVKESFSLQQQVAQMQHYYSSHLAV